jgi:hypothetical protein
METGSKVRIAILMRQKMKRRTRAIVPLQLLIIRIMLNIINIKIMKRCSISAKRNLMYSSNKNDEAIIY